MKPCPFCAEEIRDEAIKCRFCGSFVPNEGGGRAGAEPGAPAPPSGSERAAEPKAPPSAEGEGDEAPKVIVAGEIGEAGTAEADAPAAGGESSPSAAPQGGGEGAERGEAAPASREAPDAPRARGAAGGASESDTRPRQGKVIYEGAPLWRAYFRAYLLASLALLGLPIVGYFAASAWSSDPAVTAVAIGVPVACGAIALAAVHGARRSRRIRVTRHNIQREYGLLSKRIDVLELWRCRDVRYRQSLADRLLRIAHLELYTSDIAAPHFVIAGLPSSREVFESIRDAIERERQRHRGEDDDAS